MATRINLPSPTQQSYITRKMLADVTPSDLVLALADHGVTEAQLKTLKDHSTCPHCDHYGPTLQDFGVRILNGTVKTQSWCRECRSEASVAAMSKGKPPLKLKTKHNTKTRPSKPSKSKKRG